MDTMLAPRPEIKITSLFITDAIVAALYNRATLQIRRYSLQSPCLPVAASAVTIGNFDGVHLGHQALLRALVTQAREHQLQAWVLVFEPHPREFFSPGTAPARVNNLRNKLARLQQVGVDGAMIARFDQRFASLSAQQFVDRVLVAQLRTKRLIVGDDFRFGAGREGDFAGLKQMGTVADFQVEQLGTISHPVSAQSQVRISSSVLREALSRGAFDLCEQLLGTTYRIEGHVIYGKALGRLWGFPTLNIPVGPHRPALHGIYCVTVQINAQTPQLGVASLGTRPAVDQNGRFLLEVHLLNWQGNAYGKLVSVEFHHKLRDEAHFANFDLLKAQIQRDCDAAKAWFTQNKML
jgi:riboflavin kinase / FMN adenylyltransferase